MYYCRLLIVLILKRICNQNIQKTITRFMILDEFQVSQLTDEKLSYTM